MMKAGNGRLNMQDYVQQLNAKLPHAAERQYNTEDAIAHLSECLFLRREAGCVYVADL